MRRFNNNRPYWFFLGWLHEFMGLIHAVSAHFLLHKCKLLGSKIRTAQKPNELVNWRRSPAGAQGTNSGQ